jgi:hypothetical protein
MYQEIIEDKIIEFIDQKIRSIIEKENLKELEMQANLKDLDEKWALLEQFQEKHMDELCKIWPLEKSRTQFLGYNSHLGAVFYEISRLYECYKFYRGHDEKWSEISNGYVNVTYQEISDAIGLNPKSASKYLDILVQKGELLRKRGMGGLFYKFPDEEL